jgi:hypothetical protein
MRGRKLIKYHCKVLCVVQLHMVEPTLFPETVDDTLATISANHIQDDVSPACILTKAPEGPSHRPHNGTHFRLDQIHLSLRQPI